MQTLEIGAPSPTPYDLTSGWALVRSVETWLSMWRKFRDLTKDALEALKTGSMSEREAVAVDDRRGARVGRRAGREEQLLAAAQGPERDEDGARGVEDGVPVAVQRQALRRVQRRLVVAEEDVAPAEGRGGDVRRRAPARRAREVGRARRVGRLRGRRVERARGRAVVRVQVQARAAAGQVRAGVERDAPARGDVAGRVEAPPGRQDRSGLAAPDAPGLRADAPVEVLPLDAEEAQEPTAAVRGPEREGLGEGLEAHVDGVASRHRARVAHDVRDANNQATWAAVTSCALPGKSKPP